MKKFLEKDSTVNGQDSQEKTNSLKKNLEILGKSAKSKMQEIKSKEKISILNSIGIQLFVIIFISIVLCVVTVGTISYQKSKGLIESNVSNASIQTIKQVSNSLDTVFKSYIDTSFQIMFDSVFVENMNTLQTTDNTYEKIKTTKLITDKLSTYMVTNKVITNITIIPASDIIEPIATGQTVDSDSTKKDAQTYRNTEWYKESVIKNGMEHWIEPQAEGISQSPAYKSVGLSRMVRNMNNPDLSFILVLEFDINSFFEAATKVDLGDGSEIVIVNSNNEYVMAPDDTKYGQTPNIAIPKAEADAEAEEVTSGSLKLTGANNQQYLAIFESLLSNENWKVVASIPTDNLIEQAAPIRNLTIITSIIAALLAIGIGIIVILFIGRPLNYVTELMQKGAQGDLTVRSTLKRRNDEIGLLSNNFNEMMEQIAILATQTTVSAAAVLKTAAELTDASEKTSIAAKEIAIATDEIAGGASSLAMEAEKGTDHTNTLNDQMKQVNEYNVQMSISANEVEHASLQGITYMGVLIDKTGTTEQMTRAMVDKVNALKVSTSSIVKILDVLNNVTKQTNILSLNATIEAARAGAAGKGFMVVADEIRQLADQSKNSIEVVAQITRTITSEIEETVTVLLEAYPLFQEQIGSVKEANQLFLTVQAQMETFKQSMKQVTDAFVELNKSQEILSDSMNNVSAVAQQSSATSEEVASLSTEQLSISQNLVDLSGKLQTVSTGLKDSLSKFKI
ncbi:methyl-accepting chemotaxis protein [Paenibacillus endoradicis]|uniref:methyl-accepting chemotaxis protein n=1 Tax=Paenibacillus endoradicis TaxID=2972487 RepID=UPI002158E47F|nr:methyl-accepting chemotaxis protein [Paenibacillus endoradicis]MCR8655777.1 methyl-accepting chemotaxis protein [Paenibacillus endoradicis]MCR8658103.1 methyl-accepting chemotaxis protein [Paenibacillus endoradicis]